MKLITRDTDYAIRTLCFMVNKPKKVFSVSDLVKKLDIPRPFLRKILQVLHKNKILRSFKGKGGGFLLKKPKDKIHLLELMHIFQGPFKLSECLFKKKLCPSIDRCVLRKRIKAIERYVLNELKDITIASLIKRVK